MQKTLILIGLLFAHLVASAQGNITFINDTGSSGFQAFYTVGDVAHVADFVVKNGHEQFTLRGATLAAFNSGVVFSFGSPDGPGASALADVPAPIESNYEISLLGVIIDSGTFRGETIESYAPYAVTPVPEPSPTVFFCMGLTLLLLSNHPASRSWSLRPGSSVPAPSLSSSGGSASL